MDQSTIRALEWDWVGWMHTKRKLILLEMLLVVTAQIDQKVHVTISSSALPSQPKGKTSSMT